MRLGEAIDILEENGIPDQMIRTSLRSAVGDPGNSYKITAQSAETGTEIAIVHIRYINNLFDIIVPIKHEWN